MKVSTPPGAGGFTAAFIDVTVTSASNTTNGQIVPFDEDEHTVFTSVNNVTAQGIAYDQATGNFTPDVAGIYRIVVGWVMSDSGTIDTTTFRIKINVVTQHTVIRKVHSAVGPASFSQSVVKSLAANDDITATFDGNGTQTQNTEAGLSMFVERIG